MPMGTLADYYKPLSAQDIISARILHQQYNDAVTQRKAENLMAQALSKNGGMGDNTPNTLGNVTGNPIVSGDVTGAPIASMQGGGTLYDTGGNVSPTPQTLPPSQIPNYKNTIADLYKQGTREGMMAADALAKRQQASEAASSANMDKDAETLTKFLDINPQSAVNMWNQKFGKQYGPITYAGKLNGDHIIKGDKDNSITGVRFDPATQTWKHQVIQEGTPPPAYKERDLPIGNNQFQKQMSIDGGQTWSAVGTPYEGKAKGTKEKGAMTELQARTRLTRINQNIANMQTLMPSQERDNAILSAQQEADYVLGFIPGYKKPPDNVSPAVDYLRNKGTIEGLRTPNPPWSEDNIKRAAQAAGVPYVPRKYKAAPNTNEKTVDGVTYIQQDGKWYIK